MVLSEKEKAAKEKAKEKAQKEKEKAKVKAQKEKEKAKKEKEKAKEKAKKEKEKAKKANAKAKKVGGNDEDLIYTKIIYREPLYTELQNQRQNDLKKMNDIYNNRSATTSSYDLLPKLTFHPNNEHYPAYYPEIITNKYTPELIEYARHWLETFKDDIHKYIHGKYLDQTSYDAANDELKKSEKEDFNFSRADY